MRNFPERRMQRLLSIRWQWLSVFVFACIYMYVLRTIFVPALGSTTEGHLDGDPFFYHSLATELASKIKMDGMAAWTLQPDGFGPAGVLALIYLFTISSLAIVILNAALHATASVALILFLGRFFRPVIALVAALPFILSPFQMFWFSQINKDSFIACGVMLYTLGILLAADAMMHKPTWARLFGFISLGGIGALLIYIGRPYVLFLVQQGGIGILLITAVLAILLKWGEKSPVRALAYAITCCLFLVALSPLTKGAASDQTLSALENPESAVLPGTNKDTITETGHDAIDRNNIEVPSDTHKYIVAEGCMNKSARNWRESNFIPHAIESKVRALFTQRCLYFMNLSDPNPNTRYAVLDSDIYPSSLVDALEYSPRAAANGFFAPYPWSLRDIPKPSVFFMAAALEVSLFLLTLPFLIAWLVKHHAEAGQALIPITLATIVIVVYGLGVPFAGALYRYRYPFWMVVCCFGVAATLSTVYGFWSTRSTRRSARLST